MIEVGDEMKTEDIKICVLRMEGTNCEQEIYQCFKRLGTQPEFVHLNQLTGEREKRSLLDYQALIIPGGFSAGDYVRAGAIFAARIKSKLMKELKKFVEDGYPVLGICNGFQVLVETGLLPATDGYVSEYPEAVLNINDSFRFECRPTLIKNVNRGMCVFTKNIEGGRILKIPCAHAEGKLMFPSGKEDEILQKLIDADQIVFRYVDPDGNYAGYPWNPNGSVYNIAGICNRYGNVMGMMPHPERVFYRYMHPDWTRTEGDENGDGKKIFESVVDYIRKKF